jgi:hypothetical protein
MRIKVSEGEVHKFEEDGSVSITTQKDEATLLLPLGQDAGS